MNNPEREELILQSLETTDKQDTYEKNNGSDTGSQTVYIGKRNKLKAKKKLSENVIFLD